MIEVTIEDPAWAVVASLEPIIVKAGEAALAAAGRTGEVAVLLTDDDAQRELNARFRGKDASTNVLSFPAGPGAGEHLGDISLAFGVCAAEAKAQGKRFEDHLKHLIVHGVLHLVGCDHETEAEAEVMEGLERRILAALGVADPYAGDENGAEA